MQLKRFRTRVSKDPGQSSLFQAPCGEKSFSKKKCEKRMGQRGS